MFNNEPMLTATTGVGWVMSLAASWWVPGVHGRRLGGWGSGQTTFDEKGAQLDYLLVYLHFWGGAAGSHQISTCYFKYQRAIINIRKFCRMGWSVFRIFAYRLNTGLFKNIVLL